MDDFTSALYLGFCHPAGQIPPWQCLTTGVPAALREPAINQVVADQVAQMQGLERGVLAPSSLHLFWDIFGKAGKETCILADEKVYAIARWGLERAAARGARVINFKHQDSKDLLLKLQRLAPEKLTLLVVTDGWCPHCGKPAPLRDYLLLIRSYGGLLLLDDSQALGIMGKQPDQEMPGGKGGGGLLPWYGVQGDEIITICSLAKGLGVPLSVISGSRARIEEFKSRSETRVHSSPVSAAHVQATLQALSQHKKCGNLLRLKLLKNIRLFRKSLGKFGFTTYGSFFPVQTLKLPASTQPYAMYQQLLKMNIRALLLEPHREEKPEISFCITVLHTPEQLMRAAAGVKEAHQLCQRKVPRYVQPVTRVSSGLLM